MRELYSMALGGLIGVVATVGFEGFMQDQVTTCMEIKPTVWQPPPGTVELPGMLEAEK